MRAQSNFHALAPSPPLSKEQLAALPGPQTEQWS